MVSLGARAKQMEKKAAKRIKHFNIDAPFNGNSTVLIKQQAKIEHEVSKCASLQVTNTNLASL